MYFVVEIYELVSYSLNMEKKDEEKLGWLILAEKSIDKLWSNEKDKKVWNKYLTTKISSISSKTHQNTI